MRRLNVEPIVPIFWHILCWSPSRLICTRGLINCDAAIFVPSFAAGKDCEEPRVVLIDFGLAEGFLSTSSGCSGTAGYIPPETWETELWYPKGDSESGENERAGHWWLEMGCKNCLLGMDGLGDSFWIRCIRIDAKRGPADERLRRCLQHGYRVLSVDDRTGAQWWSNGSLANLWQERTGAVLEQLELSYMVVPVWCTKKGAPSKMRDQRSVWSILGFEVCLFSQTSMSSRFWMIFARTRRRALHWIYHGSAFHHRCCSWLLLWRAWLIERCNIDLARRRPWRLNGVDSWVMWVEGSKFLKRRPFHDEHQMEKHRETRIMNLTELRNMSSVVHTSQHCHSLSLYLPTYLPT